MRKYSVAILGATGAVGQEFLRLMEERNFPFGELKMLASKRSAGKKITFMGKEYTVEEATDDSFKGVEIALFAGGSASKAFAPAAVKHGAVVIDNSSAWRMVKECALIVPEINIDELNNASPEEREKMLKDYSEKLTCYESNKAKSQNSELMDKYKGFFGVFVWDFVDQGVKTEKDHPRVVLVKQLTGTAASAVPVLVGHYFL